MTDFRKTQQEIKDRREEAISDKFRQKIRMRILSDVLIDSSVNAIAEVEFNGYGDSGTVESPSIDDEDLARFFEALIDTHVDWDWYNNEGGGGNVMWDLRTDKITINGYYNVTETVDQDEIEL